MHWIPTMSVVAVCMDLAAAAENLQGTQDAIKDNRSHEMQGESGAAKRGQFTPDVGTPARTRGR